MIYAGNIGCVELISLTPGTCTAGSPCYALPTCHQAVGMPPHSTSCWKRRIVHHAHQAVMGSATSCSPPAGQPCGRAGWCPPSRRGGPAAATHVCAWHLLPAGRPTPQGLQGSEAGL